MNTEPITTRIYAEGICCPSEVPLIRRILQPMAGVTQARSSHDAVPIHAHEPFNNALPLLLGLARQERSPSVRNDIRSHHTRPCFMSILGVRARQLSAAAEMPRQVRLGSKRIVCRGGWTCHVL